MGDLKEWRAQHLGLLVSKVPSYQEVEREKSKQEKTWQEFTGIQAGLDRLCRPCPWEWAFFQGHCYFFSKSRKNWHDSITACQEAGAQLVVIKSAEEQSFLQQTSKARGYTWMGLSDLNKESTWHWVDGSPLLLSGGLHSRVWGRGSLPKGPCSFMKYWKPGQPNNYRGQEDCAEFRDSGWNDDNCDCLKLWICKKSATPCPH
ncbi:CD209 antigen-like protein C [Ctenodactylus gundi]